MKFTNITEYRQAEDLKRLGYILDKVAAINRKPLNILEIGCGNGNICYQLAHEGHIVKGIDLDENSINYGKSHFKHENLLFDVKPAEELVNGKVYDVVICSEVLEHLYDPASVLHTITRLLADNGIVIITTPNGVGPRELFITRPVQWIKHNSRILYAILRLVKKMMGYTGQTVQSSSYSLEHVQFFKLKDLKKMALDCGLQIVCMKPACFLEKVFPFSLITRFSTSLQWLDCKIADLLPITLSSGFMLTLKKA
ncbi:MAG: hypothetical protein PWR20_2607 [Bacteroidales bacterium]|nr:hypothetical protein [Bacteroidales bacterium]